MVPDTTDKFTGMFIIFLVVGLFFVLAIMQINMGRKNLKKDGKISIYNLLRILCAIPILIMAVVVFVVVIGWQIGY
jgi:uncharacterized membrane protein